MYKLSLTLVITVRLITANVKSYNRFAICLRRSNVVVVIVDTFRKHKE